MSADNLLIAVIVLLILALVGLAVLLFRPRPLVQDTAALEAVDRSGRELREEIGRVRRDLGEVGSAQRTELSGSLNNFSQTLATQMSGIATVQDGKIDGFAAQLAKLTEANEARLTEIRNTLETKLRELQGENAAKLEEMRKTVDEKLQTTLEKRLSESFKQVAERLEQVHQGLGQMQTLAQGVGDLAMLGADDWRQGRDLRGGQDRALRRAVRLQWTKIHGCEPQAHDGRRAGRADATLRRGIQALRQVAVCGWLPGESARSFWRGCAARGA